jgi:hypothetical protein
MVRESPSIQVGSVLAPNDSCGLHGRNDVKSTAADSFWVGANLHTGPSKKKGFKTKVSKLLMTCSAQGRTIPFYSSVSPSLPTELSMNVQRHPWRAHGLALLNGI